MHSNVIRPFLCRAWGFAVGGIREPSVDHRGSVSISWRSPVDLYGQSENDTVTVTDWAETTSWVRCHRCHGIGAGFGIVS